MPEVSIITALFNCADLTSAYVDSLRSHTTGVEWELVLVDDKSTDHTEELLLELEKDPRIVVIRNSENMGFSASNNRGAESASSDTLAFLNNDLLLAPGWIQPMLEALRREDRAGVIGNVQYNPGTGLIDHAGVFFGLDGMPRQARKNRKYPPKGEITEWYAVTAACMVVRKDVFLQAGGFDTEYRNGFEDIDLCVKLKQRGYRHYVCNQSQIYHCVSSSPGRHQNNDRNTDIFRARWTQHTAAWGQFDWAPEYLQRYSRHWWKFNLRKFLSALKLILKDIRKREMIYRG